jgi:hypothetical protein
MHTIGSALFRRPGIAVHQNQGASTRGVSQRFNRGHKVSPGCLRIPYLDHVHAAIDSTQDNVGERPPGEAAVVGYEHEHGAA